MYKQMADISADCSKMLTHMSGLINGSFLSMVNLSLLMDSLGFW